MAARAAVVGVPHKVGAWGAVASAATAGPVDAGRPCVAGVSAGSAVGEVRGKVGASRAALRLTRRARTACPVVTAQACAAAMSAGPAVVDVVAEIGAITAAVGLTSGAAGVAAAGSMNAAGVAVARATGREALRLLRLVATPAERLARVLPRTRFTRFARRQTEASRLPFPRFRVGRGGSQPRSQRG